MPSMTGGTRFGLLQYVGHASRNDAPYASPFAERSAPNAVLPLKAGGPFWA